MAKSFSTRAVALARCSSCCLTRLCSLTVVSAWSLELASRKGLVVSSVVLVSDRRLITFVDISSAMWVEKMCVESSSRRKAAARITLAISVGTLEEREAVSRILEIFGASMGSSSRIQLLAVSHFRASLEHVMGPGQFRSCSRSARMGSLGLVIGVPEGDGELSGAVVGLLGIRTSFLWVGGGVESREEDGEGSGWGGTWSITERIRYLDGDS